VVVGLDDPGKQLSGEYDLIYIQQVEECNEEDWEMLMSRLRNGMLPYQQILGDANPGPPGHWIRRRAATGLLEFIQSHHEDNPTLFDPETGEMTPQGESYLGILDRLTGIRHERLRLGKWVAAEGAVYGEWDPSIHLCDPFEIPEDWTRFRTVDFGYTNPFCCQWWAVDPDGRMYLYRELYGSHVKTKDWGHRMYEASGKERYTATVTDHDEDEREELERHMNHSAAECDAQVRGAAAFVGGGYRGGTIPADKTVRLGIQAVKDRLAVTGDGFPRLFIMRGALVQVDTSLIDAKKPTCTQEEIEGYIWAKGRSLLHGEVLLEEPVKEDDHGMDALRYGVMYRDGKLARLLAAMGQQSAITMGGTTNGSTGNGTRNGKAPYPVARP
jgi:phage terminase large subunit